MTTELTTPSTIDLDELAVRAAQALEEREAENARAAEAKRRQDELELQQARAAFATELRDLFRETIGVDLDVPVDQVRGGPYDPVWEMLPGLRVTIERWRGGNTTIAIYADQWSNRSVRTLADLGLAFQIHRERQQRIRAQRTVPRRDLERRLEDLRDQHVELGKGEPEVPSDGWTLLDGDAGLHLQPLSAHVLDVYLIHPGAGPLHRVPMTETVVRALADALKRGSGTIHEQGHYLLVVRSSDAGVRRLSWFVYPEFFDGIPADGWAAHQEWERIAPVTAALDEWLAFRTAHRAWSDSLHEVEAELRQVKAELGVEPPF